MFYRILIVLNESRGNSLEKVSDQLQSPVLYIAKDAVTAANCISRMGHVQGTMCRLLGMPLSPCVQQPRALSSPFPHDGQWCSLPAWRPSVNTPPPASTLQPSIRLCNRYAGCVLSKSCTREARDWQGFSKTDRCMATPTSGPSGACPRPFVSGTRCRGAHSQAEVRQNRGMDHPCPVQVRT